MTEADLELKVKWANDEVVNEYIGFNERVTLEGTQKWFAGQLADPRIILLTVTAGDRAIGYAKLIREIVENAGEYNGLAIGEPEYWGHGHGKAAVKLIVHRAFEIERWDRFWGYFPAWNDRSIGLHQKLGFRIVGDADFQRFHPGHQREYPVRILEMLRSDYERAHPNIATS